MSVVGVIGIIGSILLMGCAPGERHLKSFILSEEKGRPSLSLVLMRPKRDEVIAEATKLLVEANIGNVLSCSLVCEIYVESVDYDRATKVLSSRPSLTPFLAR